MDGSVKASWIRNTWDQVFKSEHSESVSPPARDLQAVPLEVQVVATGQDGSPHTPDVLLGAVHHEPVKSIQGQVFLLGNWHQKGPARTS